MYCSKCGTKCPDGAQSCMKCGQKLDYEKKEATEEFYDNVHKQPQETVNVTYLSNKEEICQKSRFPIAGIFLILHGMISLYYAAYGLEVRPGEYIFVGTTGPYFWPALLRFIIIIISVLLFCKKINKPLGVLLVLYSIWNILACMYSVPMYSHFLVWNGFILYYGMSPLEFLSNAIGAIFNFPSMLCYILYDIEVLSFIVMAFLATSLFQKENRFSVIAKKTWYVPGA